MKNKITYIIGRILFWLIRIVIAIYILFPIYWALNSSLKTSNQLMMTPTTFIPRDPETLEFKPTFENYLIVFQSKQYLTGLLNSVLVASSTTGLALLIGSLGAFALGKLRFRGKTPTLYVILSMTMFPQVAVLTGLYAIVRFLRIPAIPSMILSYMLFTLPFTTWVLTAFFKGLPIEIMQAARVDGATPIETFRMILLPLSAPALISTGLLAFINAWNEYLFALVFTAIEPDARTVTVAVAFFGSTFTSQSVAAAVVTTIPAVILVSIFQKRISAGITSIAK
jgi:trehalose/maltose transport system permease protein